MKDSYCYTKRVFVSARDTEALKTYLYLFDDSVVGDWPSSGVLNENGDLSIGLTSSL